MKSIRDLYKIGKGPSSSHTMGPAKAAELFLSENPDADRYAVTLYGSLAKTGVGHGTDRVIREIFAPKDVSVTFSETDPADLKHPNTLDLTAWRGDTQTAYMRVESIGGGDIVVEGRPGLTPPEIYPENSFAEIAQFCAWRRVTLPQYVELNEGPEIRSFLKEIWNAMRREIQEGLEAEGTLPGGLNVQRKAKYLYEQHPDDENPAMKEFQMIAAYAYAVAEQNADNGTIVTAPTCGACGVLPAVLKYAQVTKGFTDAQICRGLATAGIIGNLTKTNASISGAECGCQAEIGTACSMAAAALAELYHQDLDQVEYAAEVAMEHHLGLTCDPICGLVQIPCIERNAVAAVRAMNACNLSYFLTGSRNISYDMVCRAMRETGVNLDHRFRETSEGGLAKLYNRRKKQ